MGKKEFILHIRCDQTMYDMVAESAERAYRQKQDQARFLLAAALGIAPDEDRAVIERLAKRQRKTKKNTDT